jgi:hypothetical protein
MRRISLEKEAKFFTQFKDALEQSKHLPTSCLK